MSDESIICKNCEKTFKYEALFVPLCKDSIGRCPCCQTDILVDSEEEVGTSEKMIQTNNDNGVTVRIRSKFIAIIVVALAGFMWNKIESCSNQKLQAGVGDKLFIHFQSQINELYENNIKCHNAIKAMQNQLNKKITTNKLPIHNPSRAPASVFSHEAPHDFDKDEINIYLEPSNKKPSSYEDIVQEVQMEQSNISVK